MLQENEGLRRFPRKAFQGEVYLMDEDGYGFFLDAENISRGGVFVRSALLLEEGEPYYVRVELGDGSAIHAKGHVCRTHRSRDSRHPLGMGIAFDYLDEGSRAVLEEVTPRERLRASA